ncbi:MAG: heme lyase CcmF/NrfE family subunit [Rhodospirillales bacterium]|jgi:cytochrome c-type biogenesis protein CcmF|nr:heme lyase CcmF/NrfE family subunit [Pseudomonadota bacterium]MBT8005634.1 heme lyase CcmF/NrfE family subunit [Rhodospirillales bacterium]
MTPEIGHYAAALALVFSMAQGVIPLWGAHKNNPLLMNVAVVTARFQFILVLLAFICLILSFVASDFSVALVAQNSHTLKPLIYKISGVWGNHEGSMLLWILILAFFGLLVGEFGNNLPPSLRARVLSIQGLIGAGFIAFLLFTSNPFIRLDPPPLQGSGLNPLLQDPGLAFHPPFLYLGYVGFSMAFSFAIAALIEGRVDPAWARWVRPWTLVAWTSLTIGIALGSWWAYYELGWGGWWFWDPVENASFLPWLLGTALLHSALVLEKRDTLKSWTILLSILAFGASLLGTFLVRSGVLTSVHTFATDPERGVFILLLFLIVLGGGLLLYAIRAQSLKVGGLFAPISREGALILNNLFLATSFAVVLLGTLYPLLLDAFGAGKVSVGAPFFNATFVPLMVPLLIACPIGAKMAWKRGDLSGALSRLKAAFAASLVVIIFSMLLDENRSLLAAGSLGIAAWLMIGITLDFLEKIGLPKRSAGEVFRRFVNLPRSVWGAATAHFALGVMVAGITVSSVWQVERIQIMRPGDKVEIGGYTVLFEGAGQVDGPNYTALQGSFSVFRGTDKVTVLLPEKRSYPAENSSTTEAAIHTNLYSDLYIVLGDTDQKGGWATRIYFNPLVPWIWVGAILMAAGGAVSLTDRRLRVGAPRRAVHTENSAIPQEH